MAYLDRQPLGRKLATLGTAGAIELALAAGVIAALSISFVPQEEAPQITARNIPDDLPIPPPPDEKVEPQPDSTVTAPTPQIPLDTPVRQEVPVLDNPPIPFDDVVVLPPRDPPRDPPPRFTPAGARPSNDSSRWVTTGDYPARDLREGNQGTTRFRAIVGTNGRVQACEVLGSSGYESLDNAACANVTRRARFSAATDESGAKVVGSYVGSVVWRIPR